MSPETNAFFEVAWHSAAEPCAPPWRPLHELATPSAAWDDRIGATRSALSAARQDARDPVEQRVAASVVHLGLCARIIAPAFMAAASDGRVMDTTLHRMWWQPVVGGPFPLSVVRPAEGRDLPMDEVVRRLRSVLIDVTMPTLVQAVRRYSVSSIIAWGNVASAIHSAAAILSTARPDLGERVALVRSGLTAHEPLAGAGEIEPTGGFRRRSCCLIYRVSDAREAICGDCVLDGPGYQTSPSRQSQVSSASTSRATPEAST
ncbi:MAG TPA: (2Fe-2S)-binding protein [Jatrophihabitantaceae bacterium]|nr:(2Fe-2S)-binding protein [Jatrophihabitantaceae bacterium]